jgi:hypothetical protein
VRKGGWRPQRRRGWIRSDRPWSRRLARNLLLAGKGKVWGRLGFQSRGVRELSSQRRRRWRAHWHVTQRVRRVRRVIGSGGTRGRRRQRVLAEVAQSSQVCSRRLMIVCVSPTRTDCMLVPRGVQAPQSLRTCWLILPICRVPPLDAALLPLTQFAAVLEPEAGRNDNGY